MEQLDEVDTELMVSVPLQWMMVLLLGPRWCSGCCRGGDTCSLVFRTLFLADGGLGWRCSRGSPRKEQ